MMSPLYAIVDVDLSARAGVAPVDIARAYLQGGARLLQVRAKSLTGGPFLALADQVAAAARDTGAVVVINDRVDVARAAGLGVHLGQDDLPVAAARALLGPDAVVGFSTHTPAQLALALRQPVSYVAYGPVFATASKATRMRWWASTDWSAAAAAAAAAGVPLVAIGGITLGHGRRRARGRRHEQSPSSRDLLAGPETPRRARAPGFSGRLARRRYNSPGFGPERAVNAAGLHQMEAEWIRICSRRSRSSNWSATSNTAARP